MSDIAKNSLSKVPEVTLAFWIIKILATTLGETGGDAVSMTMNLGYLVGTVIFAAIFLVAVIAQIKVSGFHPFIYWTTIIATTTVGTTLADFADRSLGIGYAGGSSLLFTLLIASLAIWYRSLGTVSVDTISSPKAEMFYWGTILFSQTLGTALGDWMADTNGLGYERGALVFTAGLALIAGGGISTQRSRALCCSGALSSSRGRWAPHWAICSTSQLTTAGSRLAAFMPRQSSRPSSSRASCSCRKRPENILARATTAYECA